jgi:hypothetical protein
MRQLNPFKINTSRKSRYSRVAFIVNNFKPTRINTSAISKTRGGGVRSPKVLLQILSRRGGSGLAEARARP